MDSIESSGFPLAFGVPEGLVELSAEHDATAALRTYVRALEGMQKEALVALASGGNRYTWRMVSDEGPYLNGTDLAPFPLSFFTAGMQFSLLSELLRHGEAEGVRFHSVKLVQDNYYSMDGSALQGTMIGGAKPAEINLQIEADGVPNAMARLVQRAEQSSPAHALMRNVMSNRFALTCNGTPLDLAGMKPCREPVCGDVEALFAQVQPDAAGDFDDDIIERVSQAKTLFGVEGGAASSLQAEQKRTLHVHGEASWREGRRMESTIQLYRPIGSTFRFLCDETRESGGQASAPPPLVYLAAGIGFCFMTQIGRYATITKQALQAYYIIQENAFTIGETAQAAPVNTHVYLAMDELDDVAQKTVWMSERTCFLHAAMRGSYPSLIRAELNGQALDLAS